MTSFSCYRLHRVAWRSLGYQWRLPRHLSARPQGQLRVRSNYTATDRYGEMPGKELAASKVMASRQRLLGVVPHEIHRVVGVSFEDRQPLVSHLHRGQAVAFVKEPSNPHDPNAIMVQTLDGHTLGYVPRDITQRFPQDVCFGFVYSMGQTEEGLHGFRVAVQPTMPPVQVMAWPTALMPYTNLVSLLSGPAWEAVKRSTLERAGNRCEVTGAYAAECREQWRSDDALQVVRLSGFRAMAPEVQQVQNMLVEPNVNELELALLNGWREEDAQVYLRHMRQLQERRQQPTWKLDLSLLRELGVPIPDAIAPMRLLS